MLARHHARVLSLLAALLLVTTATTIHAQTSTLSQSGVRRSSDRPGRPFIAKRLYDDATYLFRQPDFYAVVGGLGVSTQVFKGPFNHEEPEFTEMWGKSAFADNFLESGEQIGNGLFPFAVAASSWSAGKLFGSPAIRDFGSDLFAAQALGGVVTLGMKATINRRRPNGGPYSYPSGHTTTAFITAGVIQKHFGSYAGIPAFALAGYVGLGRLQEGKHYASDVAAGAILGSYLGLKLAGRRRRNRSLALSPWADRDASGLALSLTF